MKNTKLYIPVLTLSTQKNAKLLEELKSGFKRTTNWNKYQSKVTIQELNSNLDYLTNLSFQGVKRLFVLSLENNTHRTIHTGYYIPKVEGKDYNVILTDKSFLTNQLKVVSIRTYNSWKIATGQADDYKIGYLLDCDYFNKHYKMIAIDLAK